MVIRFAGYLVGWLPESNEPSNLLTSEPNNQTPSFRGKAKEMNERIDAALECTQVDLLIGCVQVVVRKFKAQQQRIYAQNFLDLAYHRYRSAAAGKERRFPPDCFKGAFGGAHRF